MNVYSSTMHRKAKNWKQSNSSISWRTHPSPGEWRDRLWSVYMLEWNAAHPAYRPLWKDVTSRWGVMLYITYLGFFCTGDILLLLCWLIQSLVSVRTHGYFTLYFVL